MKQRNKKNCEIDALLIYPPYFVLDKGCYPSIYWLTNYLLENGFSAAPLDLNRASLKAIMDRNMLHKLSGGYQQDKTRFEQKRILKPGEYARYCKTLKAIARLNLLQEHITEVTNPKNKMYLQWHIDDDNRLSYAHLYGEIAIDLLLRNEADTLLQVMTQPQGDLMTYLKSPPATKFRDFIRNVLHNRIERLPLLAGFSLSFGFQLLPSLIIAQELRTMSRQIHICFGGAVISLMTESTISVLLELGIVDTFVKYEGEIALQAILNELKTGCAATGLSNVYRLKHPAANGNRSNPDRDNRTPGVFQFPERTQTKFSGKSPITLPQCTVPYGNADPRRRQKPDSMHVNRSHARIPWKFLNRLDPEKIFCIPIQQARGCYWGKCSFCDYVNQYPSKRYAQRTPDAVIEDIEHYHNRGWSRFTLITEALPPRQAEKIAAQILRKNLKLSWGSYLRVDDKFDPDTLKLMRESGYDHNTIGIESFNTRILQLIKKGYTRQQACTFLDRLLEAGFKHIDINIIVDIPTTTYEEALEIFRICKSYQRRIYVSAFPFVLTPTSEMGRHPDAFGIELAPHTSQSKDFRFQSLQFNDSKGMTLKQKNEIFALYRELKLETILGQKGIDLRKKVYAATRLDDLKTLSIQSHKQYEYLSAESAYAPQSGEKFAYGEKKTFLFPVRPKLEPYNRPSERYISPLYQKILEHLRDQKLSILEIKRLLESKYGVRDASTSVLFFVKQLLQYDLITIH